MNGLVMAVRFWLAIAGITAAFLVFIVTPVLVVFLLYGGAWFAVCEAVSP